MKEFKVYVGLEKDHMFKVLHSSLKNDSIQERFSLQHANSAGVQFPTRYLKIVPVSYVFYSSVPSVQGFIFVIDPMGRATTYQYGMSH